MIESLSGTLSSQGKNFGLAADSCKLHRKAIAAIMSAVKDFIGFNCGSDS